MASCFRPGVTNLAWVAAVAIYVALEKLPAAAAHGSARIAGAGLIVSGAVVLAYDLTVTAPASL